jgi:hypothetical protein
MFEQAFKNIDDVLWKDAGCTSELDYTEQTSWLLFLKYLDALEQEKATEAALNGKKYGHILDKAYRWEAWAAPKGKEGQIDHNTALTGDDLIAFVNGKLFPYLHGFKPRPPARTRSNTRSGRSSASSRTVSRAAITCARSSTTSTNSGLRHRPRNTSCRTSTKPKSKTWATPDATAESITLLDR